MTKQLRYPAEAFMLAMVLFSGGMKEAMAVGIGLIFAAVLQSVLRENLGERYTTPVSAACSIIGALAVYGMLFFTGAVSGSANASGALEVTKTMGLSALALSMVVFDEREKKAGETDHNAVLFQSTVAYAVYVVIALIREYLGSAAVFGFELPESILVSRAFAKPMLALFFAALGSALTSRILKVKNEKNSGLWVCIPVLIIEAPFVWNNVDKLPGTIVGILFGLIIYVTLRKKLALADTEKHIAGAPVEMAMLGIIYMVFSFL